MRVGVLASTLVVLVVFGTASLLSAQDPFDATPIVKQADHIIIGVENPKELFQLFSRTLALPVAWPIASYKTFESGGVFFGNVNIEMLRIDPSQLSSAHEAGDAHFIGIAFEPHESLGASQQQLAAQDVSVQGEPQPFVGTRPDGQEGVLWTNLLLRDGFGVQDAVVFLCEYTHDVVQWRAFLHGQLQAQTGGLLGVEAVKEIVIGAADLTEAQQRWGKLLAPLAPLSPGVWQLADGLAIRLGAFQK